MFQPRRRLGAFVRDAASGPCFDPRRLHTLRRQVPPAKAERRARTCYATPDRAAA